MVASSVSTYSTRACVFFCPHPVPDAPGADATGLGFDEQGEIKATGFNEDCDNLYPIFEEGKVYFISKASLTLAGARDATGISNTDRVTAGSRQHRQETILEPFERVRDQFWEGNRGLARAFIDYTPPLVVRTLTSRRR